MVCCNPLNFRTTAERSEAWPNRRAGGLFRYKEASFCEVNVHDLGVAILNRVSYLALTINPQAGLRHLGEKSLSVHRLGPVLAPSPC